MLISIQKNQQDTWSLVPQSGRFSGLRVATAEAVDMVSVVTDCGKAIGIIKAVWGLQVDSGVDVFSDVETLRALCLGKAFRDDLTHPVGIVSDGFYDLDTKRILRRCKRLVVFGSNIIRRI